MSESSRMALVRCRVTPKARKNEILGWADDRTPSAIGAERILRVKLNAPPLDGKANRELLVFLAKVFGLSKSAVTIRSGEKSRLKLVQIDGLSSDEVAAEVERILTSR